MDKDASTSGEAAGIRNKGMVGSVENARSCRPLFLFFNDYISEEDLVEDQLIQYEYLDHTADIQLHSWGTTLQQSIEQIALAMYGKVLNNLLDKQLFLHFRFQHKIINYFLIGKPYPKCGSIILLSFSKNC